MLELIVILVWVALVLLLIVWILSNAAKKSELEAQQTVREWIPIRDKKRQDQFDQLDKAIELWLAELGLPQLARKKKRQEAARQLSTALFASMFRWQRADLHQSSDQQEKR